MMKQHRAAFWLAVMLGFPLAAPGSNSIRAPRQSENELQVQESTQAPPQNNSTNKTLAEASQLSRTVVKLFNEKKYDEALPLAKGALALREAVLGADDEAVQGALINLAEIYTMTKKYGEAQKLMERLLKTHERKVGPEDAGAAVYLDKLALLAYMQRDFSKSEAAYKRALAIRETVFGENHADTATSLYLLAEFYRFTGKLDKAAPLYEQATILRGKLLGHEHPEYLKTRDRYFCLAYETLQERKLKDLTAKLGETSDPAKSDTFGGEVLNGRAMSLPKPSYPDEARRGHAQGIVVIKVTIDELGKVIEAKDMCGGNPLLVRPSLEAARKARFTPTKVSGQPVKVSGVITYNFVPV
ncbi:MAG: TonB family protein [Acidobacteriota bacterium]